MDTADAPRSTSSRLSPLGALFQREAQRLSRRYPPLDPRSRDKIILTALARAFLDADAAELAQALREGSPRVAEHAHCHIDDVEHMVATALAAAEQERR